jgi:hypothetical protein
MALSSGECRDKLFGRLGFVPKHHVGQLDFRSPPSGVSAAAENLRQRDHQQGPEITRAARRDRWSQSGVHRSRAATSSSPLCRRDGSAWLVDADFPDEPAPANPFIERRVVRFAEKQPELHVGIGSQCLVSGLHDCAAQTLSLPLRRDHHPADAADPNDAPISQARSEDRPAAVIMSPALSISTTRRSAGADTTSRQATVPSTSAG